MKQVDVLVVGGGLGGCTAAIAAAKKGKQVVLCEMSEILGKEIGGFMQIYLPKELVQKQSPLFEIGAVNEEDIAAAASYDSEVPVYSGTQRSSMLRSLLDAEVQVLYMSSPVAAAVKDGRVCGLVLATKYGSYLLNAGAVIDTTGIVSALCNKSAVQLKKDVAVSYAFECYHVTPESEGIKLPLSLGGIPALGIEQVTIHKGKNPNDAVVVDFTFSDGSVGTSAERVGHLHAVAHRKMLELCAELKKRYIWFGQFELISPGYDVFIEGFEPSSCEIRGVYSAQNALRWRFNAKQFLEYSEKIIALTEAAVQDCFATEPDTLVTVGAEMPLSECETGAYLDDPLLGLSMKRIDLRSMPSSSSTEIAVAGGGAGGAAAAMGTVGSGRDVLISEAKGMLGGTRTLGLVTAFWHGYKGGFALKNTQDVKQFIAGFFNDNFIHPAYAEAFYLESALLHDKKRFLFGSLMFDVTKNGNRITSFMVATEYGPLKIDCDVLIDGTGDGDAAFFAGAEYTYADARDGVTQGYSIWGMEEPGTKWLDSKHRGDPDSLCGEYYSDLLRGIYKGQLKNSPYGFSSLMTVRETRHIKGRYTLNLKDIVLGTTFPDTLSVSMCLFDAHGVGSSAVYYSYLFDPVMPFPGQEDVQIKIPYRCVLPEGIEGLLVVAKAISASRDAACLIRMNADIQNLGFAAGMMAAESVRLGILPSEADVKTIQPILEEIKILPEWWDKKTIHNPDELVSKAAEGNKSAMLYLSAGSDFVAMVQKAFEIADSDEKKRNLGLVLAVHGIDFGVDLIINHLAELILGLKENPKSGMRTIMTYLTVLSRSFYDNSKVKQKLIPVFAKYLEAAESGGEFVNPEKGIYQNSKVSNRTVPNFKALLATAWAAEILADKALKEPLEQLIRKPFIDCGDNRDIHVVQLYLRLTSAAARCGSRTAIGILIDNLSDERIFFKNFIRNELCALSGKNKGYSAENWRNAFAEMDELTVKPVIPKAEFIW